MSNLPPSNFGPQGVSNQAADAPWMLNNPSPTPPPKRTNIFLIVGIIAIGSTLLCCGGLSIGGWLLYTTGMQIVNETIKEQVKDAPEVKEEFGEIKSISPNLTATGQLNSPGSMVFDVEATKENGQLIIDFPEKSAPGQVSNIEAARIRKYDGREIEIQIENLRRKPVAKEQDAAPKSDQSQSDSRPSPSEAEAETIPSETLTGPADATVPGLVPDEKSSSSTASDTPERN